jgi:hypothetical protein
VQFLDPDDPQEYDIELGGETLTSFYSKDAFHAFIDIFSLDLDNFTNMLADFGFDKELAEYLPKK